MAADVLYVTFDGLLQPLAFSQVVRVVTGLASRGVRYHLLSVERPGDVDKVELRQFANDTLRSAGVGWTPVVAASMGTPRLAIDAAARMTIEAAGIARREGIKLVHARGYHGALVAQALKRLLRLPYLFDVRGYWIEERSGPGGWFSTPASYATGKFVEQVLFRGADAVVTLTELQATDLLAGLFGPPPALLEVIPTCADYDAFFLRASRPAKPEGDEVVPGVVQSRLAGKRVIALVGALNRSYNVDESLTFARFVTQISASTHILILSQQHREYEMALQSVGIPSDRYTVAAAEHRCMPDWLQWVDWGLLLLPETAAKRASMPTKLAEFFAAGVRPIFFGCNSEAARWVERAGSGYVLPSLDADALRHTARKITRTEAEHAPLRTAREITMPHFGLVSCVERYGRLISACQSGPPRTPSSPDARGAARHDGRRSGIGKVSAFTGTPRPKSTTASRGTPGHG
jgi:hypothetical protein